MDTRMNWWRLYWRYVITSMKGQMQYRVSFLLSATSQFLATGIEVAGIWALFTRFGRLDQWSISEVCLFYGVVNITFAITDALTTGFDQFGSRHIRTGNFDRLLLRPRTVALQLMGEELALRRVGRFAQGTIVFSWACVHLAIDWHAGNIALLLFAISGGIALFTGLLIVQATLAFWTVESLEIMNTMTYGGVQTAQYPLGIYEPWFRKFFTFVVPLACVTYFPVVALLGIEDPLGSPHWLQVSSPLAGFLFLAATLLFFRVGIRHYTSTGS